MEWSADFETITDRNDCRVWAWSACELPNPANIEFGNSIDGFMRFLETHPGDTFFFHNLAFDGEFIISWLLNNGFDCVDSKRPLTREFTCLISEQGKFYSMQICFSRERKRNRGKVAQVELRDSLKKLPMPVAAVAKAFDLPILKGEIDYDAYRPVGHVMTDEERAYITNDVQIVAMALQHQIGEGLAKLTAGADAFNWYKESMPASTWKKKFPILDEATDAELRKSYKGGWTYADPRFQADDDHPDRCQGEGCVFDVNSMYPYVMHERPLPVGYPVMFEGEYEPDPDYPLYVQNLTVTATLKPNHLPTIQVKRNPFYKETEYLSELDEPTDLCLTSVDLALMLDHYDVTVWHWGGGYKFRQQTGLFSEYIDYWMEVKANSKGGKRQLAKLMLNSLYGKFGTNPDVTGKYPYLREDGAVGYKVGEQKTRDPVYVPIACFVTAWARDRIIRSAQAVYPRFMYADTDSLHLIGREVPKGLEVHESRLGWWKHESDFDKAKYVRAKTYMERIVAEGERIDGEYVMKQVEPYVDVKCAGLPADLKKEATFDNFRRGFRVFGKLRPVHCKGGIVLEPTWFTLT